MVSAEGLSELDVDLVTDAEHNIAQVPVNLQASSFNINWHGKTGHRSTVIIGVSVSLGYEYACIMALDGVALQWSPPLETNSRHRMSRVADSAEPRRSVA